MISKKIFGNDPQLQTTKPCTPVHRFVTHYCRCLNSCHLTIVITLRGTYVDEHPDLVWIAKEYTKWWAEKLLRKGPTVAKQYSKPVGIFGSGIRNYMVESLVEDNYNK